MTEGPVARPRSKNPDIDLLRVGSNALPDADSDVIVRHHHRHHHHAQRQQQRLPCIRCRICRAATVRWNGGCGGRAAPGRLTCWLTAVPSLHID